MEENVVRDRPGQKVYTALWVRVNTTKWTLVFSNVNTHKTVGEIVSIKNHERCRLFLYVVLSWLLNILWSPYFYFRDGIGHVLLLSFL